MFFLNRKRKYPKLKKKQIKKQLSTVRRNFNEFLHYPFLRTNQIAARIGREMLFQL